MTKLEDQRGGATGGPFCLPKGRFRRRYRPLRGRSFNRESGLAVVEAAIIIPLLFTLIFGIMDFSYAYNETLALRHGTRAGARTAVVNTKPATASGAAWNCPIIGTSPPASGTDAYDTICSIKSLIGLNQTSTRVSIYFVAPFTGAQLMKVCTQTYIKSISRVFSPILDNKVASTQVESTIENDEPSFTATYQETPLSSWPSSCTQL